MASTNKTPHLGLCQWEATDPFLREDMNGDFARIDEAIGSRLKLELLRDLDLNTHLMNQLDIDVSDIDFGGFMFFVLDFCYIQGCSMRFNNTEISTVENHARYFFFPLKAPDTFSNFIRLSESYMSAGYKGVNYSDIDTINLVCVNNTSFTGTTKIRIWGVK